MLFLRPRRAPDRSGVGLQVARQDLQQRRLARAVAADDRDALPSSIWSAVVIEQRLAAEADGYLTSYEVCGEDWWRGSRAPLIIDDPFTAE